MNDAFSVLSRFIGRTNNAVVSALFTHCIGQPLLIEPARGERLLHAYMHGPVEHTGYAAPDVGKIVVMDISGALVSRPMPGPSGGGPQDYETMAGQFAELVDSEDVEAIVLRLDTPGGLAAGLMDFTDQIFEARAVKPVHAVVEHMAYSAGYAIASACDKVWVTRTSGVGSVGVVLYHVDQSKHNKKKGLEVTPIFAGDRKIDFSPHFPISEEALRIGQESADKHYALFVETVSRYRDMDEQAVRATQAACYDGADGVDIGFADKVGTLNDAISSLIAEVTPSLNSGGKTMTGSTETKPDDKTQEQLAAEEAQREIGVVTTIILKAKLGASVSAALLHCNLAEADAKARVEHAKQVESLCEVAGQPEKATSFVSDHVSIENVRKQLTDAKADSETETEIETTLKPPGSTSNHAPSPWSKTIEKFGGKSE